MLTLLVATTNLGKLREVRRALDGLSVTVLGLADVPTVGEPLESGRDFAENARIKACYYALHTGLPSVAEDSGLAIDALGGRPGIHSARYPGAAYADKFANLYRELAGHRLPWRARFICSLALADRAADRTPEGSEPAALRREPATWQVAFACEGHVEGEIAPAPRGPNGFGYDPIFFYPPYGRTFGEVSDAEKLAVSHRGAAFKEFRAWMEAQRSLADVSPD